MNWQSISLVLRCLVLLGSVLYLFSILFLLKKRRLTVKYAILWLVSAVLLVLFAVFPYIVLVLTNLLGMSVPMHTVLLLVTVFALLLLLSHSAAVSSLALKQKRLTQENALLEERVRRLEEKLENAEKPRRHP